MIYQTEFKSNSYIYAHQGQVNNEQSHFSTELENIKKYQTEIIELKYSYWTENSIEGFNISEERISKLKDRELEIFQSEE